jgi:hypothetical protein
MKAIRVGSSDVPKMRHEQMEAHKRFQQMLADGYKVKAARKRIHRPCRVKVQCGPVTITVGYADWQAHGSVGTIVERYY